MSVTHEFEESKKLSMHILSSTIIFVGSFIFYMTKQESRTDDVFENLEILQGCHWSGKFKVREFPEKSGKFTILKKVSKIRHLSGKF